MFPLKTLKTSLDSTIRPQTTLSRHQFLGGNDRGIECHVSLPSNGNFRLLASSGVFCHDRILRQKQCSLSLSLFNSVFVSV